MGRKKLYSVYDARTDEPVAICLPAYECGLALFSRWHRLPPVSRRRVEQTFHDAKKNSKNGISGRWEIIEVDDEEDDIEWLEQ